MKYIKTLKIDIDKKNFEVIPSVQYDSNTRFLHIQLLNDSVPFDITGCSVILSGVKEDGNPIFNSCDIINSEIGFIQAEVTEQMNAIPGNIDCEIKIYDGKGVLTSKKFTIKVTASQTSRSVVSSNEFKALTDALNKVQAIDNKAEKAEVEKLSSQLVYKTNKTETNNIQGQIDALVLGAVGDGNNAEVVQARTNVNGDQYLTLKRRNDDLENIILNGKAELFPGWRLGFVNVAGEEVLNAKIITSVDFIDITDDVGIEISIANGFQYTVHYLTSTGELRLGSTWYTDTRIFKKNYANKHFI